MTEHLRSLWAYTTNLQFLRARWYDPNIGRFISEDSYEGEINKPLSLNLYTYVENNPLTHWDPSGHIPVYEAGNGESYPYSVDQMYKIIDSKEHPLTFRDKVAIYDYMTYSKLTPEDIADGFLIVGSTGKGGKSGKGVKIEKLPNGKTYTLTRKNIVGSTYNDIKPTQDWIDMNQVKKYVAKLKAGEELPAIEAVEVPGKGIYIIDGHHRFVASQLTGIPVKIKIRTGQGPIGFPDWTDVIPE